MHGWYWEWFLSRLQSRCEIIGVTISGDGNGVNISGGESLPAHVFMALIPKAYNQHCLESDVLIQMIQ